MIAGNHDDINTKFLSLTKEIFLTPFQRMVIDILSTIKNITQMYNGFDAFSLYVRKENLIIKFGKEIVKWY
jgi:hypothetical protein